MNKFFRLAVIAIALLSANNLLAQQQQQEMMAQQQAMAQQAGVPNAGPNVLSQEAQMTQVPQGQQIQPDMDMETQQGAAANGGWNQPYSMQ